MKRLSIAEIHEGYKKREISPVDIIKQYLERIEQRDTVYNSFITITAEQALQHAELLEKKMMAGIEPGKLFGIPISFKDNIAVKGVRTTNGSYIDRDFVPEHDAQVVKQLTAEDGISLGKTNLHEYAFGITSDNPHYGAVRNPWNTDYIPGGSSGGSAAAVAADLCIISIGTDTGGSVRVPAACCGIVGLKPTNGSLSTAGVTPLSWTLDTVGPLAANMMDLAAAMEALTGILYSKYCTGDIRGLRVGVPQNFFNEHVEPETYRLYQLAAEKLESLGAVIIEVQVPDIEGYHETGFAISMSEAGYLHHDKISHSLEQYGDDVRKIMESTGRFSAYDYLSALHQADEYRKQFDQLFTKVDVLATPAMPASPVKIGVDQVKFESFNEDVFSCLTRFVSIFNVIGYPALSIPCGLTKENLPAGLQLAAPKGGEALLIKAGYAFEQHELLHFYRVRDEICMVKS